MNRVFLDSAYAIALSVLNDQYHEKAELIAEQLEKDRVQLITTRAVLLEIANALSHPRYRQAATAPVDSLERDNQVEKAPLSEELFERAFQFYKERHDKEWGLTDCISFVVMNDHGITDALTTDAHFSQAGFNVLLHETPM